jgi:hypothetical protein
MSAFNKFTLALYGLVLAKLGGLGETIQMIPGLPLPLDIIGKLKLGGRSRKAASPFDIR